MTTYTKYPAKENYSPDPYRQKNLTSDLCRIFDELDALVLENLPDSLHIPPIQLIKEVFYQKYGIFLSAPEIIQAYHSCIENDAEETFWKDGGADYE